MANLSAALEKDGSLPEVSAVIFTSLCNVKIAELDTLFALSSTGKYEVYFLWRRCQA
jgi:hypothetical protein